MKTEKELIPREVYELFLRQGVAITCTKKSGNPMEGKGGGRYYYNIDIIDTNTSESIMPIRTVVTSEYSVQPYIGEPYDN